LTLNQQSAGTFFRLAGAILFFASFHHLAEPAPLSCPLASPLRQFNPRSGRG
jgi:hypothetical protein